MSNITELINLIKRLSDLTEEEASAVLEEYKSKTELSESMSAIFQLADILRKEKAAAV